MKSRVAAYASLIAIACFGLLYSLGDRPLWADEAETALLASNIVRFGLPLADDGKNDLQRTRPGSKSDDNLWVWSPWLDEYIVAASFGLFGKSTTAARLPFALISFASLLLLLRLAWRVSASHEVALTVGLLYSTCVPFLLHGRQGRYYAVVMFAQVWLLFGAQRMLAAPTWRAAAHVGLALSVTFYCNYMVLPGNLLGLAIAALLLRRRHPRLLPLLSASGLGLTLLAAPWLAYARPEDQAMLLRVERFFPYLIYYLGEIHAHVVSLAVFVLPLLVASLERWQSRIAAAVDSEARRVWESDACSDLRMLILWIVGAQLLILGLAPDRFFRYMTPLIPLVLLLAAFILVRFVALRPLRVAVLVVLVSSNVLATGLFLPFPKQHDPGLPYPTFLRSISSDYRDRLEVVLEYLDGKAAPEHSVLVDDHELPLIFYTEMQVLDPRSGPKFKGSVESQPDWVFPAGPSALLDRKEMKFRPGPGYERITIEVPRSVRGGSRPHPDVHAFFTAETTQTFVLYRKRVRNSGARP